MDAGKTPSRVLKTVFLLLVSISLLCGMTGGLLRAGVNVPLAGSALLGQAALMHATLMICGFLGTVISIERAVAIKQKFAFLAPLSSGLAGALILHGQAHIGAWMLVLSASVFVGVNIVVVKRQPVAHTALLLISALAWLTGNIGLVLNQSSTQVFAWWFAFLVLTIAAERLEMTRLMRHRPGAQGMLFTLVAVLLAGAALSGAWPIMGAALFGTALCLLAVWLGIFDIARRTISAHGLSRYMAVCLLSGYAWLGVAGIAWTATSMGLPAARDTALHALGLGFIISMVMGHAPVILPAVAGIKLQFGPHFYLPLGLLHSSVVLRLVFGFFAPQWRALAVTFNAVAIVTFAATVITSAVMWHRSTAMAPSRSRRRG
ncbi:MAG: hypothetical protein KGL90_07350 [Burkholderiales bacterium]|nr:hypothetical protein [Burkholderiales bacterium]